MKRNFLALWALCMMLLAVSGCAEKQTAVTTAEGLIIEDLMVGSGSEAVTGGAVAVHYTGWLFDENAENNQGEKFDSSLDRGQPFEFVLGQGRVIKGWDQGVVGMQKGGKRRLIIPAELGYGARGAGKKIPPNSTLMFDIELIDSASVQIDEQKVGDGAEAVKGAKVKVHYTGWLFDETAMLNKGKKFDSSVDRGNQFEFVLGAGRVITGWDVGVKGMKVGGKRTLTIPPSMAYGARGAGENIPPNSTLIFDVELFDVDTGSLQ